MVTLIPVVFGAGKWLASLPTGYLLDRVGRRRLMVTGLLVIAACDVASVLAPAYGAFLAVRGVGGIGWAMFATVATTMMVDRSAARGRAISLLLMSETLGLLLGSVAGGWLYARTAATSPFVLEAACMGVAAVFVGRSVPGARPEPAGASVGGVGPRPRLDAVVRTPGVLLMGLASATLTAVQTGLLVFLFPLYLTERGRVPPEIVGSMIAIGVLGRLIALWLAGRAADRRDPRRLLAVGLVAYGALLGTLGVVTHPLLLGLWSLLIGAGSGFVGGLPTAIVGDRVAPALRGVAIGWLRTVTDAGMLVGPIVMGTLADAVHLNAPFLCAALVLCLLAWRCHRAAATLSAGSSTRA
jgi:MFS family permease